MGETRTVTPSEQWSPTTPDESLTHTTTPMDYAVEGFYERSDGEVAKARPFGMSYREMVRGVIHTRPNIYEMKHDELPSLEWLIAQVPAFYLKFLDDYDHSQGSPKPWEAIFRAHVLRLVKGWKHDTALRTYLKAKPFLVTELGFDDIPDQSTLWRAWNDRLEPVHEAVREAAEVVVESAREHGIPAPDPEFMPDRNGLDEPTDDETEALAEDKAKEVWQQAKPFVTDCFELQRGDNATIPEGSWWEAHAYYGMRQDMHANGGASSFRQDTTRDLIPSGDSHRYQLKKLSVEDVRRMLRETARAMVARARSRKQLDGEVMAAIDITKGHPWTGQVDRDSDGDLKEPWILGYKDNTLYFQWAVIKIVGNDVPFILDAVPVVRGRSREDIVDDLLAGALSVLSDITTVMMDREFDKDEVKDVCEDHGVYYLNPARVWKHDRHAKQIRKMNDAGKDFDVVEQKRIDGGPSRKSFYVPKREWNRDDEDGDEGEIPERSDETRQQLLDDAADGLGLDDGDMSEESQADRSPFESLIADMADEEEIDEPEDFSPPTVPFETNHPLVDADPYDDREMAHQIGRMMARYKRRWGIENGFKKIKKFLCRTTSKDHEYRYFNFAFACVLYNCWRIVDLLVQLSIKDDPTYSPEIDANLFLTLAKKYYGLDPPD
jgi:putative transposase